MTFDIITIFPKIFDSYLKESLIAKGQKKKLIKINVHNLRDWTTDSRKTVDGRPFGGELGMVMKVEPIFRAVTALKKRRVKTKRRKTKVILFTPRGKQFNQKMAYRFSKYSQIIMICGRYEGVDERVAKYIADTELSIGDYDLMGGELPAMVTIETIARLIPGVIGKHQLLKERITEEKGFIEYSQYTRPEVFSPSQILESRIWKNKPKNWRVPKILLSGNHKKIKEWREKHGKVILS